MASETLKRMPTKQARLLLGAIVVSLLALFASAGSVSGDEARSVTAGSDGFAAHTCAIIEDGTVRCWGGNDKGQLGIGVTTDAHPTPASVCADAACETLLEGVVAVSAGGRFTCAVVVDLVKCWGWNNYSQLGTGVSGGQSTIPVNVCADTACESALSGASDVEAGDRHTCALMVSGGIKCWGRNDDAALGDGSRESRTTPVDVTGLTSGATSVVAGAHHTCALTTSGGAKCWGNANFGRLETATRGAAPAF